MIRVGAVILTEEEWALGQSVTDEEFWRRYEAEPDEIDEASEWIGDSCRAIDRRVYG